MVGILVKGSRCATSWFDLDLTFALAVVTLTYKVLSGLYLGTLAGGYKCAMSWFDLDLTFDLVVVTLTFKILSCC